MEPNGIVAEFSILVVDDSEAVRETVSVILSVCGYQCESAKNGVEAMQRVRQRRFDAVVTDLEMPEMNGLALTSEIRQHFSSLPVMIMTGHTDDDSRESAMIKAIGKRQNFQGAHLTAPNKIPCQGLIHIL